MVRVKNSYLLFMLLYASIGISQNLSVSGNVQDTSAKAPLANAVVMAIKLMDSTLVDFTRTDNNGVFKLKALPIDTYQVIISHPKFSDMGYFIFGDKKNLAYDFGKIILQPKSNSLDEVTIFAFKDPVYYSGDTLIYTADSFKTRANATVEDLLKKLPGLKVDAKGAITTQGKKVDKVLVDGDEFFGGDATIATKNLSANSVESVQVYEKKTDGTTDASGEVKEVENILNLKLKEDAKKGYFGKLSGASDFQKFYEGEALVNYFKKKLKIAVFGLATNTPRAGFGWQDAYKFGLDNEGFSGNWNEDADYSSGDDNTNGIPQTIKTGFYYANQLFKKTKLNINYTYNNQQLNAKSSKNDQYFLIDTSYSSSEQSSSIKNNESHAINFIINQKLDSLTSLEVSSKIKVGNNNSDDVKEESFFSSTNLKTRTTDIINTAKGSSYDIANSVELYRAFKKKYRFLSISYSNSFVNNESSGILKTDNNFYTNSTQIIPSFNQKKTATSSSSTHAFNAKFIEPITKKIKLETAYEYIYNKGNLKKKALNNIGGEYSLIDSIYTNEFQNSKQINLVKLSINYTTKKVEVSVGSSARNIYIVNDNLFSKQLITQNINNVLPFSRLKYKFSSNTSLDASYRTSSSSPSVNQLQPVRDNTNPNFINSGNPNLLPTFNHLFRINFYSYKSLSGKYISSSLGYNIVNNDFSISTYYDSIGRTVSQAINVNGNSSVNGNMNYSFPLFSKKIGISPQIGSSYSTKKSKINNQENITNQFNGNASLTIDLNIEEKISWSVTGAYNYYDPSSTISLQTNKPYSTQSIESNIRLTLPKKIIFESDANYTINSQRANGYNVNYIVWNASIEKTLLKNENLMLGFHAYDILNQNTNISRTVYGNVITDIKTNIITQYFLLKVTFKFNNNKTKEGNEFE